MNKLPIIEKASSRGMDFKKRSGGSPRVYFLFFWAITVASFFTLFIRLFHLTVVEGDYYRRLADQNRIREIVIEPKRGALIDRKGITIVYNDEANVQNMGARITSRRHYNYPQEMAQVIGYRQLADENDLQNDSCLNKLRAGSKVGKQGIEKLFECDLRGSYGKKLIEVDARGKYQKTLTVIPPVAGQDVQLSLDAELQKRAYDIIKDKKAAVVAIKPSTGEILAMVSTPSFNPQDFEDGAQDKINSYFDDKAKPLFNRALEGTYPPGSTFKPVIATGALEEKAIDDKTTFEDTGTIKAGTVTFGNWYFLEYGKKEGTVDIVKAIRRSNDIFFYHTGAKLGVQNIKKWAEKFGYGTQVPLGLPQAEGVIPSPYWKEEVIGDQWYLGDTYNLSIGQGFAQATPFQVARAMTPFANGGYLCTPQLLKTNKPQCKSLGISQKTMSLVREGMKEACSPGGTGWPLFDFRVRTATASATPMPTLADASAEARLVASGRVPTRKIQVACKTGTAESSPGESTPHAWISTFAPFDNPEIVVTVLVEQSGQGSDIAGPIARDVLKAYFERTQ